MDGLHFPPPFFSPTSRPPPNFQECGVSTAVDSIYGVHLVLPGAAQHSLEVGANHLRVSLAQQHGSSLAQHANHIPLPHASCNIVNKHNSQRLSAWLRAALCRRAVSADTF